MRSVHPTFTAPVLVSLALASPQPVRASDSNPQPPRRPDTEATAEATPALGEEAPAGYTTIVVTGSHRTTELSELPASVSVISTSAVKQRSAAHLDEVISLAPNVNMSLGSSRARFFQIRGVGELGQFLEPLTDPVGVLVDGVDFSGLGNVATLFDVSQVEVLRGPQGTRYGANAMAGMINIETHAPTPYYENSAVAEGANYGQYRFGVVSSGPLVGPRVLYRVAAQQMHSDGFTRNAYFRNRVTGRRNELTSRAKLRLLPTDQLTVDAEFAFVRLRNGYDAFSLDNDRTTWSDEPGRDNLSSVSGALKLNWRTGIGVDVRGYVAAESSDTDYGYDEDWSYVGFHPDGYSSTDRYIRDRAGVSAELRALSSEGRGLFSGAADWTVGLYAQQRDVDLERQQTFLTEDFTSRYGFERYAVFGQLDSNLGGGLHLSAGLRGEAFQSHYSDNNMSVERGVDPLVGGQAALGYEVLDGAHVYAGASRGIRPGGFNTDGRLEPRLRIFSPEVLWNYELGFKSKLLNGRVRTHTVAFFMQRRDPQVRTSQQIPREDGSTEFVEYMYNAGAGRTGGLETDFRVRVLAGLAVEGSLGLLFGAYDEFINTRGEPMDGRQQAHAPKYQYAVGASWRVLERFVVRGDVEGRDAFYFSDTDDARSSPYTLMHARLAYVRDTYDIALWGRNLANTAYPVRGYHFRNDPRTEYAPATYVQLGEPRRVGVTMTFRM